MIEASAGVIAAGEPDPAPDDMLDTREMTAIAEDKLESLGHVLAARRDEWVTARRASGVEKRWIEDLDQYHGRDATTKAVATMMEAAEAGYPITNRDSRPQRSTVYVNITRSKTNAAEARVANMLFPSDDRNWGLKPTPNPDLTKGAQAESAAAAAQDQLNNPADPNAATGNSWQQPPSQQAQPQLQQPLPPGVVPTESGAPVAGVPAAPGMPGQIVAPGAAMSGSAATAGLGMLASQQDQTPQTATEQLEIATRRCKAMQDEIDDQLIDCQYNGEGRKLIHYMATLGTGVMKGPVVVSRTRKAWTPMADAVEPGVYVLEIVKETVPISEAVNPWNVWPDPSCGDDIHNGSGIFQMTQVTGKQLRELADQPGYMKAQIGQVLEAGPDDKTYQSPRDQHDGAANGGQPHDKNQYQLWEYWGEFSPDDLRSCGVDMPDSGVESISGCVIFVNQIVIKAFLNPIETGDIPYDFCQWELVDDSVWGYGVPFLMRPAQRVLNAAWRQLMDNSGLSVGPQLFIKRKGVTPANGVHEITGRKVWLVDEETNARDAFAVVEISNNGQEIQQIIELAMQFADTEASIPALNQGEKGNAPDTVGGITILMSSSNVVLGRIVKQYDDSITRPHITRYYDWNMAYSENPEIKGDFQVDARGSSALLVRDMQAQALLQLGQYQGSGIIAPFVNWEAWFKQVLKLQHIDPTDIMKTEAEIAALQNTPPQATPEQVRAQAQLQIAQIRAGAAQQVAQSKVQGELQYAQMMQVQEQQSHAAKQQEAQDALQLAMLQYAHEQKMSLDQVRAELAKTQMQEQTKRELAAADIQLRVSEAQQDRQHQVNLATHNAALDLAQPTGA